MLDLVFVTDHFLKDEHSVEVLNGISDHEMVLCCFKTNIPTSGSPQTCKVLNFDRADDVGVLDFFDTHFDNFLLLSKSDRNTVDMLWNEFKTAVNTCVSCFIPQRTKRIKRNPWITREIIHVKRKINRLRKKAKKTRTLLNKNKMALLNSDLGQKIKSAKYNFFNITLQSFIQSSPVKFWNYANPKNKSSLETLFSDKANLAKAFNDNFLSVFATDNGNAPSFASNSPVLAVNDVVITEQGIFSLLLNLNTKKNVLGRTIYQMNF